MKNRPCTIATSTMISSGRRIRSISGILQASADLLFTGGGAPPPPRTDADARARRRMASRSHGRTRWHACRPGPFGPGCIGGSDLAGPKGTALHAQKLLIQPIDIIDQAIN